MGHLSPSLLSSQVPEDENMPKSGGLAGWLSRYLSCSFPELAHLLFQRRSAEAALRCWFRREVMFTVILERNFDLNRFPGEMVGNGNKFILVVGDRRRNTSKTSCVVQFSRGQEFSVKNPGCQFCLRASGLCRCPSALSD